jgi:hypothetical protein
MREDYIVRKPGFEEIVYQEKSFGGSAAAKHPTFEEYCLSCFVNVGILFLCLFALRMAVLNSHDSLLYEYGVSITIFLKDGLDACVTLFTVDPIKIWCSLENFSATTYNLLGMTSTVAFGTFALWIKICFFMGVILLGMIISKLAFLFAMPDRHRYILTKTRVLICSSLGKYSAIPNFKCGNLKEWFIKDITAMKVKSVWGECNFISIDCSMVDPKNNLYLYGASVKFLEELISLLKEAGLEVFNGNVECHCCNPDKDKCPCNYCTEKYLKAKREKAE